MLDKTGISDRDLTRLALSLCASLVILFGCIFWTWQIGRRSNLLAHQLYHQQEGLDSLKAVLHKQEARR
jgi:hypothetical protein